MDILDDNPIKTDSRGQFHNRSADSIANNGKSKLSDEQIEERCILHAKHQMYKSPSVKEITEHWFRSYKITMSVQSEHEWAKNNQKKINFAIAKLEEEGMPVLATPNTVVSLMLSQAGRDLLSTISANKKHQKDVADSMQSLVDPFKAVGLDNEKKFFELEKDARKPYEDKIDVILKINRAKALNYKAFSASVAEQSKILVELMKVITDLNKTGQALDAMLKKRVNDTLKELGLKRQEDKTKKSVNVLEALSEDDRTH